MNGKDLFIGLGDISQKYYEKAEMETISPAVTRKPLHKPVLIAAIIALLMLLVGCVTYLHKLEHLVVVNHTTEVTSVPYVDMPEVPIEKSAETISETNASPFVSEKVLSMQGYEGSPAYNALQEWLTYATDYVIRNPECRFQDDFQRPEAYIAYTCYSQEMVDKVDELCSKYGLHILGKSEFIMDAEGMEANGLSGVLREDVTPRCFYGHIYQDMSFVASGELELSGDYEKTVQFQMHNIKKDAFYTVTLGLNNISDYVQWNYTTLDGYNALLALNDRTGEIFVENEGRFISITVGEVPDAGMVFTGLPTD